MAKPVLLVVMDGVGFSKTGLGDAVTEANTPTLDWLMANCQIGRASCRERVFSTV